MTHEHEREAPQSFLLRYERQEGERLEDGLLSAFDALGVDLLGTRPPLVTYVNPDALERLHWSNPDLAVRTRIWEYPVDVTDATVTIYAPE